MPIQESKDSGMDIYRIQGSLMFLPLPSENPLHSQGGGLLWPPPPRISGILIHRLTKFGRNTLLGIHSLYKTFNRMKDNSTA